MWLFYHLFNIPYSHNQLVTEAFYSKCFIMALKVFITAVIKAFCSKAFMIAVMKSLLH